jgi:hypothetical protein
MDMIARYFAGKYFDLVFKSYLPEYVTGSDRHFSIQYLFTVLGDPDEVNLQISFGMGSEPVTSHSDNSKLLFA